jgi:hypothetical protein
MVDISHTDASKLTREQIVLAMRDMAVNQLGLSRLPQISARLIETLGLKGVAGIVVGGTMGSRGGGSSSFGGARGGNSGSLGASEMFGARHSSRGDGRSGRDQGSSNGSFGRSSQGDTNFRR